MVGFVCVFVFVDVAVADLEPNGWMRPVNIPLDHNGSVIIADGCVSPRNHAWDKAMSLVLVLKTDNDMDSVFLVCTYFDARVSLFKLILTEISENGMVYLCI